MLCAIVAFLSSIFLRLESLQNYWIVRSVLKPVLAVLWKNLIVFLGWSSPLQKPDSIDTRFTGC